jgi:hypothetical protein
MWLQWLLSWASLMGIYALARPRFSLPVTTAILILSAAAPVFQQGLEQSMAEPASLLCGVLFLHATVRFLQNPEWVSKVALLVWFGAAILVKGTGVCLLPVPFVAYFAFAERPPMRTWWIASALFLALLGCAFWLFWGSSLFELGGITFRAPWPLENAGKLAGWGCLGLAAIGLRREPLAVVCGALIASAFAVSYFARAMAEPRHWIQILPAILLLAGYGITRLKGWALVAGAAVALLLFPWLWYRQAPAGRLAAIRQIHIPARILVSSGSGAEGEGGFVAVLSASERYPASMIVRASKVLSKSDWNGNNYKKLATTPEETERILDELAVDVVVLDTPASSLPPHHALLASTMVHNPAWRACGASGKIVEFCRTLPPRFPRKPLMLEAGGRHLLEKIEDAR